MTQPSASVVNSVKTAARSKTSCPTTTKIAAESVQSEHKFTVVLTKDDKFMRRLCMNCEHPACASVCPVGAMHKTAEGPVVYDVWKCIGCRYCMTACAFSQPKYEWHSLNPRDSQMHYVPGPHQRRQADGMCRDLPHRGHQVWRSRRPHQGSAGSYPPKSIHLLASYLRL